MCGLIYGHNFLGQPVNNVILQQYDKQKHRGQQGFGVFDGKHLVHAADESRILNWLCKDKNDSELLLMHHRFPTSTINVRRAAHPFTTGNYFGNNQYILIHNGHISNADKLYNEHYEAGIRYQSLLPDTTFNDSEALLWDFARFMEGKQKELTAYGGIAFICIKLVRGKLDKMYFGRNNNPLIMLRDKTGVALSSEGEGEPIERDTLYTFNYKLRRLTTRKLEIPAYQATTYKYTGAYASTSGWEEDLDNDSWYKKNGWVYDFDRGFWVRDERKPGSWLPDSLRRKFGVAQQTKLITPTASASLNPSQDEIQKTVFMYLTAAEGHFEEAYWAMESDFTDCEESGTIGQMLLLEEAIDSLLKDPEYISESSISSYWEEIWQSK
jgi:predicted glutamine amidotransferase